MASGLALELTGPGADVMTRDGPFAPRSSEKLGSARLAVLRASPAAPAMFVAHHTQRAGVWQPWRWPGVGGWISPARPADPQLERVPGDARFAAARVYAISMNAR
jgi:hypothetical protein